VGGVVPATTLLTTKAGSTPLPRRDSGRFRHRRHLTRAWLGRRLAERRATTNGFIPEDAQAKDFHEVVSHGDVTITAAEPALLFAMKLRASRSRSDLLDLDVLVDVCEIASRAAAVELYEGHYTEDPLSAKAKTWLDQHFPASPQPTN